MYFSTNRGTCEQTQRESKEMHECEGNWEKKSDFVPFFLLLFRERQFTILQWVKTAQLVIVSCWGNNDCVIKMADRYCYQSFFKELFIHIITTFIITVLQMLSTLLSIWGIIVLQYAVHKIDRKDFFICKRELCPV